MILKEVGGEVGMFYYYFKSKQELFDKALELFMERQGEMFSHIMEDRDNKMKPGQQLDMIMTGYVKGMTDFKKLANGEVHWSVLYALHELTLNALLPSVEIMIQNIYKTTGQDDSEVLWLAPYILKGISGLLHQNAFEILPERQKRQIVADLICRTLKTGQALFN